MHREVVSRAFGAFIALLGAGGLLAAVYSLFFSGRGFRWNLLGLAVVSLIVIAMGLRRLFPSHYAPIPVDHDDPLMKHAIETARREIARFAEGVKAGKKQPFVKFPLKSPAGDVEHIWGIAHSIDDGVVHTSLANEPVHSQEHRDPRFAVALADIEDWILVDGQGVTDGGYTHLAMARIYKRDKGYIPHAMRNELAAFKDLDLDELHSPR